MSVPRNWWNIENVPKDKQISSLTLFLKDVYNILNKGLLFQDNFRGAVFSVNFSAANTDTKILHGLAFVPTRYLVLKRSANMVIYDGIQAANDKEFYLRSSATGDVDLFLF